MPEYVFVANPDRNTLSRINVQTLSVLTTEVGELPAVVLSTPDETKAVVFNKGSDSVSVVDSTTMQVAHVDVREDFNQMVMSPNGAGSSATTMRPPSIQMTPLPRVHAPSTRSVWFIWTTWNTPHGRRFNPRDIQFSNDGARAVIVSDAWLAVVDLGAEAQSPHRIQISDDTVYPPEAEEVVLTPNGDQALIRQLA